MGRPRKEPDRPIRRRPPATTPEARENQLISLAIDLAEEQLMNGTAPVPVITHYLKLATTREKLEQERLREENALLRTKNAALESQERSESFYKDVINAFRSYSGQETEEDYED